MMRVGFALSAVPAQGRLGLKRSGSVMSLFVTIIPRLALTLLPSGLGRRGNIVLF